MFLKCNNLNCRRQLKHRYYITPCKHIFCEVCADTLETFRKCIRCRKRVNTPVIVKTFKPVNLAGYSIGYIHDVMKKATDFYLKQVVDEMKLLSSDKKRLEVELFNIKAQNKEYKTKPKTYKSGDRRVESSSTDNFVVKDNSDSTSAVSHDSKHKRSSEKQAKKEYQSSRTVANKIQEQPKLVVNKLDNSSSDDYVDNTPLVEPKKVITTATSNQKLLPEDIKNTRKMILSNLIKLNNDEQEEDQKMPKYNKFE